MILDSPGASEDFSRYSRVRDLTEPGNWLTHTATLGAFVWENVGAYW